jgi:hypothetical protein
MAKIRRGLLQGIDLSGLTIGQQAARFYAQSCGHHRRDHMAGVRIADGF